MKDILPAALAFAGGMLTEFINYLITRAALKRETGLNFILPIRTIIAACFIAALYFIGKGAGVDIAVLLIAGALGATAGLVLFTLMLKKNGKGGES